MKKPRLRRSNDRWLAGVCGGIAEFLGWTPGTVRLLWSLVCLFTGLLPGTIAYAVLAFVMPPSDDDDFDLEKFRAQ